MKTHNSMVYILILCLFGLVACHKDTTQPNRPNHESSEYFPNSIGDSWDYNVTDSVRSTPNNPSTPNRYSVKVIITSTKKLLDGKYATVWQYQYPWGNDTNYVRIVGDTIKVFDLAYSKSIGDLTFPRLIFVPPFEINKRWNGKLLFLDSSRVMNQSDVITQYQTFTNCFNIYHHYLGPNLEYSDNYWFKPNVGMVRIYYVHYDNGPTRYQTWQLKTYSIH